MEGFRVFRAGGTKTSEEKQGFSGDRVKGFERT